MLSAAATHGAVVGGVVARVWMPFRRCAVVAGWPCREVCFRHAQRISAKPACSSDTLGRIDDDDFFLRNVASAHRTRTQSLVIRPSRKFFGGVGAREGLAVSLASSKCSTNYRRGRIGTGYPSLSPHLTAHCAANYYRVSLPWISESTVGGALRRWCDRRQPYRPTLGCAWLDETY